MAAVICLVGAPVARKLPAMVVPPCVGDVADFDSQAHTCMCIHVANRYPLSFQILKKHIYIYMILIYTKYIYIYVNICHKRRDRFDHICIRVTPDDDLWIGISKLADDLYFSL